MHTAKIRADAGEDGTQHLFVAAVTLMGLASHVPRSRMHRQGQGVKSETQGTESELHKTLCVTVQEVSPQQSPLLKGWAGYQRYLTAPATPNWVSNSVQPNRPQPTTGNPFQTTQGKRLSCRDQDSGLFLPY